LEISSDDEVEFEVEEVVDRRLYKGELQYLVKWVGWSSEDNSWEPEDNLENCSEKLNNFNKVFINS